ncbi:hypothetical protein [Streptomyces sp. NPDC093097]|uniref:hypothetical protein n=1 Tax=Streptomyces sp. NPDC093097 TaxID=3366027 RepID=UPI00381CFCA0
MTADLTTAVGLFDRLEAEIWPMPRISTMAEPLTGATEEDLNEDLDRDYSQKQLDEILGEGRTYQAASSEISGGFCGNCGQPVTTCNGTYTCTACGHNG